MFGDGSLSFQEFIAKEPHPIWVVQDVIFEALENRVDVVMTGSHAVNAYVDEARWAEDVDVLARDTKAVAQQLADYIEARLPMELEVTHAVKRDALIVRQANRDRGRRFVHVHEVAEFPAYRVIQGVRVLEPAITVAHKMLTLARRWSSATAGIDRRDVAYMLLAFPEFKNMEGPVSDAFAELEASPKTMELWKEIVEAPLLPEDDDEGY